MPLPDPLRAFTVSDTEPGALPLIYASPHSGRHYPEEFLKVSKLDRVAIRQSEDLFVDQLLGPSAGLGIPLVAAMFGRAFVDLNRHPYELDQSMFNGRLPSEARTRSARVAAGLGSVARVVAEGKEIYSGKIAVSEALHRITTIHEPYHAALRRLLQRSCAHFGYAVLIDWHSMPSTSVERSSQIDIVLGDRFGSSCSPIIMDLAERELKAVGFTVVRNIPFAGGYTTENYGQPEQGVHTLQIEINRKLYSDELQLIPSPAFEQIQERVTQFSRVLQTRDWRELSKNLLGRIPRIACE